MRRVSGVVPRDHAGLVASGSPEHKHTAFARGKDGALGGGRCVCLGDLRPGQVPGCGTS